MVSQQASYVSLIAVVDTTNRFFQPPEDDDDVPPLELCIRTK